jgi:hypothetical protein
MWNSMNTKSLLAAVLITATIQGSLLWRMNTMATEGAVATATQAGPEIHQVTLEPVLVVGKYKDAFVDENRTATSGDAVVSEPRPARLRIAKPG